MRRILVWDLPVRLFHWLLAAGFLAAAAIALLLGEDSSLFPYHMMIGLTLAVLVVLRVLWGFVGTRHARFGSFAFPPTAVVGYLREIVTGSANRHIGHNPGSAYAIFLMLAIVLGLAITGLLLTSGGEAVKEVHELLAYSMLAVVAAHVAGVAIHTLRHRENITLGMVDGHKSVDESMATGAISSSRPLAALVMVAVAAFFLVGMVRSYDPGLRTTRIPLLGVTMQLGEGEGDEQGGGRGRGGAGHEDDD